MENIDKTIPQSAQNTINRAMSKEPSERVPSCTDFAAALSDKENKEAPALLNPGIRSRIILIITGISIIAALGVYLSLFTTTSQPETDMQIKKPEIPGNRGNDPGDSRAIAPTEETPEIAPKQEIMKINCGIVPLVLVKIKAGTFMMGSPEEESGRDKDETQHKVTLTKDYWLGKFEVTQAQYEAVMGFNPSLFKGGSHPVEGVSWKAARDFCTELNRRYAGKLPAGYKFDLPTEAQWEYACRAGTATALNNGKNLTSEYKCSNLDEVGWYNKNRNSKVHKEVGQKRPNNWGVYDMHGNVSEWCRDWYGPYTGSATDPKGPLSGWFRVSRGGWSGSYARDCRSAYRESHLPDFRFNNLGFRLALVPVR